MTTSFVEIERCSLPPLSMTSPCARRPLILTAPRHSKLNFGGLSLVVHDGGVSRTASFRVSGSRRVMVRSQKFIHSVARTDPSRSAEEETEDTTRLSSSSPPRTVCQTHTNEPNACKEVDKVLSSVPEQEDLNSEIGSKQKSSQLRKRVVFGLGIGICGGGVVLAGGWVFTLALVAAAFAASREYFELVRSRGITAEMTPPPRYVSRVCSVICAVMPVLTLYFGQIDIPVTFATFFVAMALLLQKGNPRFAQLSSTMFGLFYCGYLPCFWVKLRCGLAVPSLNTRIAALWPALLGGQTHWDVGLVATLISVSSIIAADTFAFIGGKAIGKTPLTNISPKKTWEGTIIGLGGCVATSVVLSKIFFWPTSLLSAIAFGFLNFFGSIFGDLMESMIKRDAGVKDSGSLIPGHGGILDRVDSYIFTGALAYSFIKTFLPLYGV